MFLPYFSKHKQRTMFFVFSDFLISIFVLFVSYKLAYIQVDMYFVFFMGILNVMSISIFRGYSIIWRYFSLYETKDIILSLILSHSIFVVFAYITKTFSIRIIIINFALYLLALIALRFSKRIYLEMFNKKHFKTPMVLIGASHTAQALIKDYSKTYDIQAIIDNDDSLKNTYISNIKIHNIKDMDKLISSNAKIVITKELESSVVNAIFTLVHTKKISDIKIVKEFANNSYNVQDISIEDLLPRSPKDFDKKATSKFIENKTILITGAGGSIGSEIVKQCVSFGAKEILLLDHSEFNLYTIGESVNNMGFENHRLFLKSVVNKSSLEEVFKQHKIQILIHAAAYKHVSLVQSNMKDAMINNIIGTKNAIDLAIKYNLESFVLISTDKAIRPTSIMGATKRICELYAQNVNSKNTIISAVRFGNVLNSSGSVIPKFKSLIEQDKNITVTHKDVTRYFMLISEACELTLQASSLGVGSQVFILDMGEPIKIVDLAQNMLNLYNKNNLKIEFTGLKEGEKLYEELLIKDGDKQTQYQSIIIAKDKPMDINIINKYISKLEISTDYVKNIKEIIPEFLG